MLILVHGREGPGFSANDKKTGRRDQTSLKSR
jgi:hypothetical protein